MTATSNLYRKQILILGVALVVIANFNTLNRLKSLYGGRHGRYKRFYNQQRVIKNVIKVLGKNVSSIDFRSSHRRKPGFE